jgi:radical SAM protein with 4Fe4S-binding SPASM domain
MGRQTSPRVAPTKRIRDYGSCTVIYDRDKNSYIFLDDVAHDMFSLIRKGTSLNEIANTISALYCAEPDEVITDVEAFIADMIRMGILLGNGPLQPSFGDAIGTAVDTRLLPTEKHLFDVMADNLWPFSVTIEITDTCNQDCIHCYRPAPAHNIWTPKTFENLLVQLRDLGTLHIDFTGGEPFTHPQLMEFVRLCDETDFVLTILTNGTLISKKDIDLLSNRCLRRVYVSLYSAKPHIHESITQTKGSFKATLESIRNMVACDIPVTINCPIMSLNQDCVEETIDLARSLGTRCEVSFKIAPSYKVNKWTRTLNCFSKEVLLTLVSKPNVRLYDGLMCKYQAGGGEVTPKHYCQAGFRSFTVSSQGEVILCTAFRYPCGNLQDQPIRNIWEQGKFLQMWRNDISIVNARCRECLAFQFCEPCPANTYTTSGRLREIDELTCQFGKTLYEVAKAHHQGGDVRGEEALLKAENCDH